MLKTQFSLQWVFDEDCQIFRDVMLRMKNNQLNTTEPEKHISYFW